MNEQTNNESLAKVAADIATQFAVGELCVVSRRASKVSELISISDTLRELYRGGLRAPAIAEALQAKGQKFSSATVRRALKIILRMKRKTTSKFTAVVAVQTPSGKTASAPTTKATIKLGKPKTTTQTPATQSAGGLTDAEIEAKLKDHNL